MNASRVAKVVLVFLCGGAVYGPAQEETTVPGVGAGERSPTGDRVAVTEVAADAQIDDRLTGILESTPWFEAIEVEVSDGVVTLEGRTDTTEHRRWAGEVAGRIQDVVAVVNGITLAERSLWDLSPGWSEVRALRGRIAQALPVVLFAVMALGASWLAARGVSSLTRSALKRRRRISPLIVIIIARLVAFPVLLLGIYVVLQVAGLTRLALTVLGGTGLMGIVIGFAFRDIAENFLASVLLSMRQPFRPDDLIEVTGHTGIVRSMNTRCTVLMTLEGNHIQIPNATIFKNTIINYTANPNRRADFMVGIGYEDSVTRAQELISGLLTGHPAVLDTPEPMVLVETLGAATVDLRIYYWFDATRHSPPKLKSSLQRLTKRTLSDAHISMPDSAREVVFPRGVPVTMIPESTKQAPLNQPAAPTTPAPSKAPPSDPASPGEPVSTQAEGQLYSETADLREQARAAVAPEAGEDLLEAARPGASAPSAKDDR